MLLIDEQQCTLTCDSFIIVRAPTLLLFMLCGMAAGAVQAEPPQDPTRRKQVLKDTFTAFNTAIERYVPRAGSLRWMTFVRQDVLSWHWTMLHRSDAARTVTVQAVTLA
jgi:hypothetical protein